MEQGRIAGRKRKEEDYESERKGIEASYTVKTGVAVWKEQGRP